MDHPFYDIVGAVSIEPAAMPMDTHCPLAHEDFAIAVGRVRRALQKNVAPLDTYARAIRKVPVSELAPDGVEAYGKAVRRADRWACGEEGAQAALSLLGPETIVHIIQGSPASRRDMVTYMGHELSPAPEGPATPFLGPSAPRRGGPTPSR